MSYKECIKHAIFQGGACGSTDYACQSGTGPYTTMFDHDRWCQVFSLSAQSDRKLISEMGVGLAAMLHLMTAGLIEHDNAARVNSNLDTNSYHAFSLFSNVWRQNYHVSSFDNNVYLRLRAFYSRTPIEKYLNRADVNKPNIVTLGAEYFIKKILDKNVLLTQGIIFEKSGGANQVAKNKYISTLSAKLASELDAKIDDGRPATGNLLGIKPSKGCSETDAEKSKQYCYDASGNDIERAIYNTSSNTQYGCDLIKVIEPVK